MKSFVDRVKQYTGISIEIALGVFVAVMLASALQAKASPVDRPMEMATAGMAVAPVPGTSCLRDNVSGSVFTFDNTSGAYTYSNCMGFTLSGTGVTSMQGSIVLLSDRKPDRAVSAGFNTGQKTGTATISFQPVPGGGWQQIRVYDTTSFGMVCSCPP